VLKTEIIAGLNKPVEKANLAGKLVNWKKMQPSGRSVYEDLMLGKS